MSQVVLVSVLGNYQNCTFLTRWLFTPLPIGGGASGKFGQ